MNTEIVREGVKRAKTKAKRAIEPVVRARVRRERHLDASQWGLETNAAGNLSLHGIDLAELAERHSSPLMVVDGGRLRETARRFASQPSDGPRFETYYSYKSNPVPGMLRILDECGIGAEVTSLQELKLALALGVDGSRIIMNGPGWTTEAMELALASGVSLFNLNHAAMVDELAAVAERMGVRARVGLRVAPAAAWSGQFGTPMAHAMATFRHASRLASLEVVGIHLHIGGMIRDTERLAGPLEQLLELVDQLHDEGIELEVLDIGGGLASPTVYNPSRREYELNQKLGIPLPEPDPADSVTIEQFMNVTGSHIAEHYRAKGRELPTVILEPGRALTSDTMFALTSVLRTWPGLGRDQMVLDASINVLPQLDSEYHHLMPVRQGRPDDHLWAVAGPTCAPFDVLWRGWQAPDLQPGELIAVMDTGAYFVPLSNSFSFAQPAIVLVDETGERLLRRRESFDDVVDRDQMDAPQD